MAANTLKIQGIHHVAYRCKDAKATVEWYIKHLDMTFVLAFFELPSAPAMGHDGNTPAWVPPRRWVRARYPAQHWTRQGH